MTNMITEEIYEQYLLNLLSGQRAQCARVVADLMNGGMPVKRLYTDLFQRSMYQVGELWEYNKISVSVEHLATSVTESLIAMTYPAIFGAEHVNKTAIVSCGSNEHHQIGARMVADIFELNGWNSHFLGANTPADDLIALVGDKKPDILALSLSVYHNLDPFVRTLEEVTAAFPDLPVLAGGQAFRWGGEDLGDQFPGVEVIRTIDELEARIRNH
jgi:MerR family transcriptional regulator, light-induced transcriptional regulator